MMLPYAIFLFPFDVTKNHIFWISTSFQEKVFFTWDEMLCLFFFRISPKMLSAPNSSVLSWQARFFSTLALRALMVDSCTWTLLDLPTTATIASVKPRSVTDCWFLSLWLQIHSRRRLHTRNRTKESILIKIYV